MYMLPLPVAMVCTVAQDAPKPAEPPHPLEAAFQENKLTFTRLEGFYKFLFTQPDGKRKQVAYIRKTPEEYRSLKIYETFSLCYDEKDPPTAEFLHKTFQKRFVLGGLVLEAPSATQTNWRIRFRTEVPVSLSPTRMRPLIEIVQATADTLEKEFFPTREDNLCGTQPPPEPSPEKEREAGAARFKSALTATAFNYGISENGANYSLVFNHTKGRQQRLFISMKPSSVADIQTYFVYTTVWIGDALPDEALLRRVLTQPKKLGAFYLFRNTNGKWAIRFGVHFDATELKDISNADDTLVTNLKDTTYFVNQVGEAIDSALNGEKDIK